MTSVGIIVGRFQVPEISKDVYEFVNQCISKHRTCLIILCEAPIPGSRNNPLSIDARKAMMWSAFPGTRILSLKDHPIDEKWSEKLDEMIREHVANTPLIIYGTKDRFIKRYKGRYHTSEIPDSIDKKWDAKKELVNSTDFRKGVVHAFEKTYPKVYPTVDVALFRKSKRELLLGYKSIDSRWRFPGGFVDPEDDSFMAAAQRELEEECGKLQTEQWLFEETFKVDDWRYRDEQDKIITTLFSADLIDGEAKGSDDIAVVKWFDLEDVHKLFSGGEVATEHKPLFNFLLKKYFHS